MKPLNLFLIVLISILLVRCNEEATTIIDEVDVVETENQFQAMEFENFASLITMGTAVHTVVMNGAVEVKEDARSEGDIHITLNEEIELNMMFRESGLIIEGPDFAVSFPADQSSNLLLISREGGETQSIHPAEAMGIAMEELSFLIEASFWHPLTQATAALMALANTSAWQANVGVFGANPGVVFFFEINWCKVAAYAAATLVAAAATAGCAALLAGCAAGTAVTFGGMSIPCSVLIGLCGGGIFAGTAAAYEAVLALWSP